MTTPLGLARQLRLSFPAFVEVRVVRDGAYLLRAYCAISSPHDRVSDEQLKQWKHRYTVAGTVVTIEQVAAIPSPLEDEEVLLRRTSVPRVIAESSSTTGPGLVATLRELFPSEVVDVAGEHGHVTVHVAPSTPAARDQELLDTTRLLMACDARSLTISRQPHVPPTARTPRNASAESAVTLERISADVELLHERLTDVLTNDVELPELPRGSSTYASVHDGVSSLLQRLALFDRVYVSVPFKVEDFAGWAGARFDEFVDVLPTGRVIPVFEHSLDRYEAGLTSKILEGGAPRILLRGEHTLRMIRSFVEDHAELSMIESVAGAELRRVLAGEQDADAQFASGYHEALAEIASRLPAAAVTGQPLGMAMYPLVAFLDGFRQRLGLPEREIEMLGAFEHRAATEAISGVPMSRAGHYLDGALRFVYGVEPTSGSILRIPDPELIGRICFPDATGLTPREFAESFRGGPVDAMRALMSSERVLTADGSTDLVNEFNKELQVYSRRADREYVAVGTILAAVGAFALGVPTAIAGLSLELARRVLGRKAPALMASVTAKLTRTTREAALLARIQDR
jgi:hypothetical protein